MASRSATLEAQHGQSGGKGGSFSYPAAPSHSSSEGSLTASDCHFTMQVGDNLCCYQAPTQPVHRGFLNVAASAYCLLRSYSSVAAQVGQQMEVNYAPHTSWSSSSPQQGKFVGFVEVGVDSIGSSCFDSHF